MTVEYEPFSKRWRHDPYPVYRELRERAPVHWAPQAGVYCVSRHEDVAFVLKSPDLFSSEAMRTVLMNANMGPLPLKIIAEMLGVETERREDFRRWSDAIVAVASGAAKDDPVESGHLRCFGELYAYLRTVVRERRRNPSDDLLSALVDPGQDGVLDELDVIQFVVLLLVAGNETTTNLIGNAVHALLAHPDQLDAVCRHPERMPALVEEALRFDPPIQMVFRTVTRDVEMGGARLPRGALVAALLGSANRDERVFEDPDRFDIERDTKAHLAFGHGIHSCLGAALARLEARVALEALVPELPGRSLREREPALIDSFLVRGRTHLTLWPAAASVSPDSGD